MQNPPSQRNSVLIQQLCKHIAQLQQRNTQLQQQLCKDDYQKQIVFNSLGMKSWEELLSKVSANRDKTQLNFQNTSSTLQSSQQNYLTVNNNNRTPLRQRKNNNQSAYQSPIQSESRLMNKSIRGDTDRNNQQQFIIKSSSTHLDQYKIVESERQNIKRQPHINQTFALTLNNLALHSQSKQCLDLKSTQEQNMILSIQNTKLRQRLAKLQAIIASMQYH